MPHPILESIYMVVSLLAIALKKIFYRHNRANAFARI
jgi:hypothetical protein